MHAAAPPTADPNLTLDRLTVRAGQLYSLPAVAVQVLRLTSDPAVDTRALKSCIECDPALTGKILRVVNSSLFGLSRQVSDLHQALALLGIKPLKLLVLGFSLPSGLLMGIASDVLARYWRHTLTKAVAGREISETIWNMPGDDAFVAGLLQDIGMLLLIQELGEPYVRFINRAFEAGKEVLAMETATLGFDHVQLSARLLQQWGLPQPLVDAVGWRPSRQTSGELSRVPALPRVLRMAELLSRVLADNQPRALAELLEESGKQHQLTKAQLETLVENLGTNVRGLADVLKLQLADGLDYRDVLVQAHEQLSRVASDTAADVLRWQSEAQAGMDEEELLQGARGLAEAAAELANRPLGPRPTAEPSPARAARPAISAPAPGASPTAPTADRAASAMAAMGGGGDIHSRLAMAAAACRQARMPLSLVLVALEAAPEASAEEISRLRDAVALACQELDHPSKICLTHGPGQFAIILPQRDRQEAVSLANSLMESVRSHSPAAHGSDARRRPSVSVGLAGIPIVPRNFPVADLLDAAHRCLNASRASGGGVVKSIEIF